MFRVFCPLPYLAFFVGSLLLVLASRPVSAGPHEGGTLLLHAARDIVYTTDTTDYCGRSGMEVCGEAVAEVPASPDSVVVCYVLAAFPETATPSLMGVAFGLQYDEGAVSILAHGACGEFELATPSWPANGSGTAVTWTTPQAERLEEVYWFAAYASDPAVLTLAPHPTQGAYFADDATPSALDAVAGLGSLGFGASVEPPCLGGPEGDGGEGEGARLLPLAIGPDRIDPRVGCWTLLVLGETAGGEVVDEVVLRSDRQELRPTYVERTTAESRLYTFEGLEDAEDWQAVALARGRVVYEKRLAKAEMTERPEHEARSGSVTVILEPGSIAYEPGEITRAIRDVPILQPRLATALAYLGATTIRKVHFTEGENPPEGTPNAVRWRIYRIYFEERHSSWVASELLQRLPGVEAAEAPIGGHAYDLTDPCDGDIDESRYQDGILWWLRHPLQSGDVCTGANYGWCASTGSGQVIGMIDTPFMSHRDIRYAGGNDLGISASDFHGMACAGVATALANGIDVVGTAFDAGTYAIEIPPDWDGYDLAEGIGWARLNLPSDAVISTSLGAFEENSVLRTEVELANAAGFPIFAVRNDYWSYPGAWDQSSAERWVLSVGGSRKNGTLYGAGVADIYAPTEDMCVLYPFTGLLCNHDNDTGSFAVPQVAAAAAMAIECGASSSTPWVLYSNLLNCASSDILDIPNLLGVVGVNDVANLTATPGLWEVRLEWDLTNPEGVYGFAIESAASCWGPFQTEIDIIHVGDPLYTVDGIHYVVELPTLYERDYAFQLLAIGTGGETARYYVEGAPESAVPVTPGAAPVVSLTFPSDSEAELRWVADPPGANAATHYWVYRGVHGSMADCAETELQWGVWYEAEVPNTPGSCSGGPSTEVCWYDDGLAPGVKYYYRVVTARQAAGVVEWASELSNEVNGYGMHPSSAPGVEPAGGRPVGGLALQVRTPSDGRIRAKVVSQERTHARLDLVDVSGRVVWEEDRDLPLGVSDLDCGTVDEGGVYFVRVRAGGSEASKKVVVLN